MAGIVAAGIEIPSGRLARNLLAAAWGVPAGRGERAVAGGDEDVVTMAVAAGAAALARAGSHAAVDTLVLASTTSPYREKAGAAVVAAGLGLSEGTRTLEVASSLRCGLDALRLADDLVSGERSRGVLVVASEQRPARPGSAGEQAAGDAAVALLVTPSGSVATIDGWGSRVDDLGGTWRLAEDRLPREFEPRAQDHQTRQVLLPSAVARALSAAEVEPPQVARAVLEPSDERAAHAVARRAGIAADAVVRTLVGDVGDTGAVAHLLALMAALPTTASGHRMLVAAAGDGASAAVLTRGSSEVPDLVGMALRRGRPMRSYEEYAEARGLLAMGEDERELDVSPVAYHRRRRSILAREGARCTACGTMQFPPAPACAECGSPELTQATLGTTGVVYTFTNDHLVGGRYVDQALSRCVVDLDGGGRFYTTMTDCDPATVRVGMPVELTFRLRGTAGGFRNYGWKCRPREVMT